MSPEEIAKAEPAALSAEERLLRLLRQHHDHHLTSGPIGLQDGEGGWIEIDNGLEYSESSLYLHTEAALKNAPPPDDAPMPRGGIQAHWWQIGILERRKRKAAESQVATLRARLAEVEAALLKSTGALEALFAMVNGEVPSLLEDDHHYDLCKAAIEAGNAALAQPEGKRHGG